MTQRIYSHCDLSAISTDRDNEVTYKTIKNETVERYIVSIYCFSYVKGTVF